MKKSKWLDCQGNEFFPKQKGTPSLVKIEHKNTATLDSARSKKNLKSQFCNYPAAVTVSLMLMVDRNIQTYTNMCHLKTDQFN